MGLVQVVLVVDVVEVVLVVDVVEVVLVVDVVDGVLVVDVVEVVPVVAFVWQNLLLSTKIHLFSESDDGFFFQKSRTISRDKKNHVKMDSHLVIFPQQRRHFCLQNRNIDFDRSRTPRCDKNENVTKKIFSTTGTSCAGPGRIHHLKP